MSIEIWQFPAQATDSTLANLLLSLGYRAGENPFWHRPERAKHFFWSDAVDFKSTSGVDASIFALDDHGKKIWKVESCDWVLRTRTSIWASSFDKEFQNSTVRAVKRKFGGRFYNDNSGFNRYIIIHKQSSTPASRGLFAVRERLRGELDKLEFALPKEAPIIADASDTPSGLLKVFQQLDPNRVIYNALIPFLIAALEHFFRESFEILLRYDDSAKLKLANGNKKVEFSDAAAVSRGDIRLESIVSGWFSFQNLSSINKAYTDILEIDILKPLRCRKKVRAKLPLLVQAFDQLIETRHGVVHHFALDYDLSREMFLDLLHLSKTIIEIVNTEFERKIGVEIGPG